MERTRTIRETVTAGNLRLEVEADADGVPKRVSASFVRAAGDEVIASLDAEQWERIAAAIEHLRRQSRLSDMRCVCPDHGYFSRDDKRGRPWECPECHPAEAPAIVNGVEPGEAA